MIGNVPISKQETERLASLKAASLAGEQAVGTSATLLLTAGEFTDLQIEKFWVSNPSMMSISVNVFFVPDGSSPVTPQITLVVAAQSILNMTPLEGYRMLPGSSLHVSGLTAGLFVGVWGFDVSGES